MFKISLNMIKAISFYSQEAQKVLDRMIAKKPECRHIITSFCYNGRNSCAEEKGRNRARRTIYQVEMTLNEMKSPLERDNVRYPIAQQGGYGQ